MVTPAQPATKPKKRRVLLYALGIVLAVIAVAVIVFLVIWNRDPPKSDNLLMSIGPHKGAARTAIPDAEGNLTFLDAPHAGCAKWHWESVNDIELADSLAEEHKLISNPMNHTSIGRLFFTEEGPHSPTGTMKSLYVDDSVMPPRAAVADIFSFGTDMSEVPMAILVRAFTRMKPNKYCILAFSKKKSLFLLEWVAETGGVRPVPIPPSMSKTQLARSAVLSFRTASKKLLLAAEPEKAPSAPSEPVPQPEPETPTPVESPSDSPSPEPASPADTVSSTESTTSTASTESATSEASSSEDAPTVGSE